MVIILFKYIPISESYKDFIFVRLTTKSAPIQQEAIEEDIIDAVEDVVLETTDIATEDSELHDVTVSGEIQHESASAQTSQYVAASQEIRHTFSITGVINAKTGEEVSMTEAIEQGLLDQQSGMYRDNVTNTEMPIPEAMGKGLIRVESTKTMQTREEVQSVGIMTITIRKEKRSFTVISIKHPVTEETLSVEDAVKAGVYLLEDKVIKNTDTGETMSIEDAVTCGAAEVEYKEEVKPDDVEVMQKTLAVSSVIDKKEGKKVSFHEAVKRGLIIVETSQYVNNVTGEKVYGAEALKKGYIRAKVVDDPSVIESLTAGSGSRRSSVGSMDSGQHDTDKATEKVTTKM